MLELEGFPTSWTEQTIVSILKSGDPIILSNYRTIMIGHCLANYMARPWSHTSVYGHKEMAPTQPDWQLLLGVH